MKRLAALAVPCALVFVLWQGFFREEERRRSWAIRASMPPSTAPWSRSTPARDRP
jgi:hypothetical protein